MNKKILSFVYNKRKKEFLILKTGNSNEKLHGKSKWYTVTGSVEEGESYKDTVKRELKEEIGLDADEIYPLKWGCIYEWDGVQHEEHYFIAFSNSLEIKLDNLEVIDYLWVGLNEFVEKIAWDGNKSELKTILKLGIAKKIDLPFIRIDDYISKDILKTIFIDGNNITVLSWHESNDFSKSKDVMQVYGICFNKREEILIIGNNSGKWCLPGGTPEKGEIFEETLKREVDEEANIEIGNLIPIGYNKIEEFKDGKESVFYQLRYIAEIAKLKKRATDPATNKIFKTLTPQFFRE